MSLLAYVCFNSFQFRNFVSYQKIIYSRLKGIETYINLLIQVPDDREFAKQHPCLKSDSSTSCLIFFSISPEFVDMHCDRLKILPEKVTTQVSLSQSIAGNKLSYTTYLLDRIKN